MPLFARPDGDLVSDLSPVRRIMPHLMRARNGSCVYYEQEFDLSKTLPFLDRWNRAESDRLTVFELIVAACGRVLHARPGLNRFVSGGRIYQRRGVQISVAAKVRCAEDAPADTIKLQLSAKQSVRDTTQQMRAAIREYRAGGRAPIDTELRLLTALPTTLVSRVVTLASYLDRWNLMPAKVMHHDPMFTSVILTDLGSLGLDRGFHHLYEYGTASLFGAVGALKRVPVLEASGELEAHDLVSVGWTFDERINDGHYCTAALDMLRTLVEDPASFVPDVFNDEPLETSALERAARVARPNASASQLRGHSRATPRGRS